MSKAIRHALEWRVISFLITILYFWVMVGEWHEATIHSFILHGVLFVVQIGYNLMNE